MTDTVNVQPTTNTPDTVTQAPVVTEVAPQTTAPVQVAESIAPPPEPVKPVETPPVEAPKPPEGTTKAVTEQKPATAPEVTPKAPDVKAPETFLGDKTQEVQTKPAETKAEEVKPIDDGGQTEQAPPPTFDPFTVPEGTTLDQERVTKFTELLSKLELDGKAAHEAVQKFGQEAVDFHVSEVQKALEEQNQKTLTYWEKTKNDWKEQTINDPDIGGNRLQTTLEAARNFIRIHGGSEEQQQEIREVMEATGLGNHPVIIKLFSSAYRDLGEGKPLAAGRPVPAPKSKTQTLYGNA